MSSLIVQRGGPTSLRIHWTGLPSFPIPVELYIERAGSFTGPWTRIAGPIRDDIVYVDTAVERGVRYFYRMEIVHPDDSSKSTYIPSNGGATYGPEETLLVAELRRRIYQSLYWEKDLVLYYPAKSSGQFCSCYDTTRQKHDSKCLSCYGRGYLGGFYNPIVLPVQRTPKQESGPEVERTKGNAARAFFPGIFPLHRGDVYIDSVRDIFIVAGVDVVRNGGAIVKHAVTGSPVPADHLLHNLPVDLSLLEKPDQLMVEVVS